MKDYNFAKNYENIKLWEYKEQTVDFSAENNIFDQFLNILKSYPETFLLLKSKKILYLPSSFILAAVGILEIISIIPKEYQGNGRIGAQLQPNVDGSIIPAKGIKEILYYTNTEFSNILIKTINGYKSLFTDFSSTSKQLSGPVKIIEIGAQLSNEGPSGLFIFAALISINLAVLNSLPFPLLDGGQFALILIEAIRGRPIPEKIQLIFMQSGFIFLVGLSILLIIRDTSQLEIFKQLAN